MNITINGVALDNYILDTPITQTKDAELDKATIQTKSSISIQKYDKVVLSDSRIGLNKVFCVFDYVEKYEGDYTLTTINLISPTKILENIIINGMAITTSGSLQDQFELACDKIGNQHYFEFGNRITINHNNISLSGDGQEFFWNGQTTAREIFDDILESVDARVIVTDYTITNELITSITLGIEYKDSHNNNEIATGINLNQALINLNNNLDEKNKINGFETYNDAEYQIPNIVSIVKNGATDNLVKTSWMPLRDDNLLDDTGNWHILTQEPIYSVNNLKMIMPLNCEVKWCDYIDSSNLPHITTSNVAIGLTFDISNYIVEKDLWDILSINEQRKHLYYTKGERGIYNVLAVYKRVLFSDTTLELIANEVKTNIPINTSLISNYIVQTVYSNMEIPLIEINTNGAIVPNDIKIHQGSTAVGNIEVGDIQDMKVYNHTITTSNLKYSLFKLEYTSYIDSLLKHSQYKGANVRDLSIIKNQNDRTIDIKRYDASQQSLINRLGEREAHLDILLLNISTGVNTMWQLGDYMSEGLTNKWIITKREFTPYGDGYKIRYTFSYKFNATNSQINLKRDKRTYEIPKDKTIDRYIMVKNSGWNLYDSCIIGAYDINNNYCYCLLDIIKYGGNNSQYGCIRLKDNYGADYYRTKYNNNVVNASLRYCDTQGEAVNFFLYLASKSVVQNVITNINELPKIDDLTGISYSLVSLYNLNKDKFERLIFVLTD